MTHIINNRFKYYQVFMDSGTNYSSFIAKFSSMEKAIEILSDCEVLRNNLVRRSSHNVTTDDKVFDWSDIDKVTYKLFESTDHKNKLEYEVTISLSEYSVSTTEEIKVAGKPYVPSKTVRTLVSTSKASDYRSNFIVDGVSKDVWDI